MGVYIMTLQMADFRLQIGIGVLVAICCALGAAGCRRATPEAGAAKRPLVGVSLLTQTHAFYKDLEDGLREEATARNMDLVVVACEMDPAKQASQIEDFVAQRVSAILVAPCDSNAIGAHLAGPERAHIPVFSADIAVRTGTSCRTWPATTSWADASRRRRSRASSATRGAS